MTPCAEAKADGPRPRARRGNPVRSGVRRPARARARRRAARMLSVSTTRSLSIEVAARVVLRRCARGLHAKGEADPLPDRVRDLRDAVGVMELRLVAHHQEAAGFEVDVQAAPRRRLRADRHPPGGAQGQERDRKSLRELVEMIVVGGDAVAPVAVPVEADAGEAYTRAREDLAGRLADGRGHAFALAGVAPETEVRGEARHVDVAVVHPAALRLPFETVAQCLEPRLRDGGGHETGGVGDPSPLVVGDDARARFEQRPLRRSRSLRRHLPSLPNGRAVLGILAGIGEARWRRVERSCGWVGRSRYWRRSCSCSAPSSSSREGRSWTRAWLTWDCPLPWSCHSASSSSPAL